jgi:hypothetical protein
MLLHEFPYNYYWYQIGPKQLKNKKFKNTDFDAVFPILHVQMCVDVL